MIFGEWDEEEYRKVMKREAYEDGMEEGLSLGSQKTARQNARNFLMEGDSPEKIARCCSLPLEDVLALKEELSQESVAQ